MIQISFADLRLIQASPPVPGEREIKFEVRHFWT